ncbi:hypothetical protein LJC11_00610 [Bacteroidales bacterium OttesenSCG-928-I21]|nr:hypothetical protein [Bacteroidales bacterium OttesenSCG-928-I21]
MEYKIKMQVLNIEECGFHLIVKSKINQANGIVLIDTGASNSIFDLNLEGLDKNKLNLIENEHSASGFNSTIENIYLGTIEIFKLGRYKFCVNTAIFTPLDHINSVYQSIGLPNILGIIGCDFLLQYNAIINIEEKYLFLKK